jgi:uncharacterized coiled-coil DUF342 family protein
MHCVCGLPLQSKSKPTNERDTLIAQLDSIRSQRQAIAQQLATSTDRPTLFAQLRSLAAQAEEIESKIEALAFNRST